MATDTEMRAPIIKPKTGQDFLESTSFQISQDDVLTNNKMSSIFKSDYPPYSAYGRTQGAKPPPLSEVMHKDERFFFDKGSETTKAFEHRKLDKPEIIGASGKLRVTNFKMDRDTSKFNSFRTMNTTYFGPKMEDTFVRPEVPTAQKSYIPQGDREKELQPLTNYRDRFMGHDTNVHKTIRAPSMHEGGPPTIKGDGRQAHFSTTHNETFMGRYEPPVQTLPVFCLILSSGISLETSFQDVSNDILHDKIGQERSEISHPEYFTYNVPTGDPCKVVERETTMNASFQDVANKNETSRYNIEDVSRVLNQTNFKQHDGHFKWNDYNSTATASFRPSTIPVERYHPGKHRNHSDFPEGDLEAARVNDRVNLTTNRFYHSNPPRGLHNTIINGANLRTRSNVWFGEPPLGGTFYNTTNANTYPAKNVPFTYKRGGFYKESDVPLQYYSKSDRNNTTAFADYQNPRQGKTVPNAIALDNLKKSHIFPPISDLRYFSTTNNDTFTPKSTEKYQYDSGRLQKSSVPLGTMSTTSTAVLTE